MTVSETRALHQIIRERIYKSLRNGQGYMDILGKLQEEYDNVSIARCANIVTRSILKGRIMRSEDVNAEVEQILAENIPGIPEDVINAARCASALAAYYFGNLTKSGLTREEALRLTETWIKSRYGATQ